MQKNQKKTRVFLASSMLIASTAAFAIEPQADPRHQLIVLFDTEAHPAAPTGRSIAEASRKIGRSIEQETVHAWLGRPLAAQLLLKDATGDRPSRNVRTSVRDRLNNFVVLTYPSAEEADKAAIRLKADPSVLSVEPNWPSFKLSVAPTDPAYVATGQPHQYQWGLRVPSHGLESAWDRGYGTATVAVLDSGIDPGHPDLTKAYRSGWAYNAPDGGTNVDERDLIGLSAGHGTHVAGIVAANASLTGTAAASYRNPAARGSAGLCFECSLIVVKLSNQGVTVPAALAAGLSYAVSTGAQIITMSFGAKNGVTCNAPSAEYSAMCSALAFAAERDVVMVAATGNDDEERIDFPASDPRVIPVGGIDDPHGNRWSNDPTTFRSPGSNYGERLRLGGFVAPAKSILSSFYRGASWNASQSCQDDTPNFGGLGDCTGTSMATPYIAGVMALLRSADPLQSRTWLQNTLRNNSSLGWAPTNELGAGVPHAGRAVSAVLGASNQLTPLFAFRGSDYFYTVSPQFGAAATYDTLRPRNINKNMQIPTPIGASVNPGTGRYHFPGVKNSHATAQLWVYSTRENPRNAAQPLLPLRRFVRCDTTPCQHTSNVIDRAYSTLEADFNSWEASGYAYEGVDGYLHSPAFEQPKGTVAVYRSCAKSDCAVFPESQRGTMMQSGFSVATLIGYAYENFGYRPTYWVSPVPMVSAR